MLKHQLINGWPLFFLVTAITAAAMLLRIGELNPIDGAAVSSLIQYSVRWSVPWLYLAFAASSLRALFPGTGSLWLLRNRRIVGLLFAAGMGWQLMFILWMVSVYPSYYSEEVYLLSDVVVQIPGYLFLFAMTATSFRPTRKWLGPQRWNRLHKIGIYFLWGTVWSTYWYELYYYGDIQPIDYLYYWLGIAAWAVRPLAWGKNRGFSTSLNRLTLAGLCLAVAGALGACLGGLWSGPALAVFTGNTLLETAGLILPFTPILMMAAATTLLCK